MLSLFVMVATFWMVIWEYKTDLFLFLFITEGTDAVDNSIAEYVWGSEDELPGVLSDKVGSYY